MKNFLNHLKKYKKDWLAVAAAVLIMFLAVSADGFSDLANRSFWWNFWTVVNVAAILTCIVGWVILYIKDRRNRGQ